MADPPVNPALGAQPHYEQTRTIGINGTWHTGPGELHDNNNSPAYTRAFYAVNSNAIQAQAVVRGPEPYVKGVRFPSLPPVRYPDLKAVPGLITPPEGTVRDLMAGQMMRNQVDSEPVPMDVDKDAIVGPGPRPFPKWNEGLESDELMTKVFGDAGPTKGPGQWGMPEVTRLQY